MAVETTFRVRSAAHDKAFCTEYFRVTQSELIEKVRKLATQLIVTMKANPMMPQVDKDLFIELHEHLFDFKDDIIEVDFLETRRRATNLLFKYKVLHVF